MRSCSPLAREDQSQVCASWETPFPRPQGHRGERSLSDPRESPRTPVLGGWWRDSWGKIENFSSTEGGLVLRQSLALYILEGGGVKIHFGQASVAN